MGEDFGDTTDNDGEEDGEGDGVVVEVSVGIGIGEGKGIGSGVEVGVGMDTWLCTAIVTVGRACIKIVELSEVLSLIVDEGVTWGKNTVGDKSAVAAGVRNDSVVCKLVSEIVGTTVRAVTVAVTILGVPILIVGVIVGPIVGVLEGVGVTTEGGGTSPGTNESMSSLLLDGVGVSTCKVG